MKESEWKTHEARVFEAGDHFGGKGGREVWVGRRRRRLVAEWWVMLSHDGEGKQAGTESLVKQMVLGVLDACEQSVMKVNVQWESNSGQFLDFVEDATESSVFSKTNNVMLAHVKFSIRLSFLYLHILNRILRSFSRPFVLCWQDQFPTGYMPM